MKRRELLVFLGPTLSWKEASRIAPCHVLPPARQGDVWRALHHKPRAIALIDGVFEAQPSVWHHELLAAMEEGVAVFGASSMGALRACELAPHGMVGVGQVYRWYQSGVLNDDSDVALLHADKEHQFRALTVPHVNVLWAAEQARKAHVLNRVESQALLQASRALYYQDRNWKRVVEKAGWKKATQERWNTWFQPGDVDIKAQDARSCLEVAAQFVRAQAPAPQRSSTRTPSSYVRRRRMTDGSPDGLELLRKLKQRSDAEALTKRGLTRLLLAHWARAQGLKPTREDLEHEKQRWKKRVGRKTHGMTESELNRLLEDAALETLLLREASRMLPDGPSPDEGLLSEARYSTLVGSKTSKRRSSIYSASRAR